MNLKKLLPHRNPYALLLLCMALLLTLCTLPVHAAEDAPPPSSIWQMPEPEEYLLDPDTTKTFDEFSEATYASDTLPEVTYSHLNATQQVIYRAYLTACQDVESCRMVALDSTLGATRDDAKIAVNAAMSDHPEVFWTGGGYSLYYHDTEKTLLGGISLSAARRTVKTTQELQVEKERFAAAANAVLARVDTTAAPPQVALALHDALAAAVSYDASADGAYAPHTAYQALVNGTAVCDGYTKAYTWLLAQCRISAAMVASTPMNHAWNLVQLGGDWYEIDVTWDDENDQPNHYFFGRTTAEMARRHNGRRDTDGMTALLPEAFGTSYAYEALIAQPAPTIPTANYGTNVEGFVSRLYRICFGREPDNAGFNDWVGQLKTGKTTGTQAAYGFLFSKEFQQKNYCSTDYVKQLYRAFMGREADKNGLQSWVAELENGKTREEVFNGFAMSSEFKNLCKQYHIQQGDAVAAPQYGTVPHGPCSVCGAQDGVTAFVTRLYEVCLNRKPDRAGLSDWTGQLWEHRSTGRSVARGFLFSKEFTQKGYDNATYVEYLYKSFFGRASDAAGKADWLNRMAQGMTREQVFDGFAGSREFDRLCNRYGIVRG